MPTRRTGKLGAQEINDWYRLHADAVGLAPTEVFKHEIRRLARHGGRVDRDLGERAAVETICSFPLADDQRAILLSAIARAHGER